MNSPSSPDGAAPFFIVGNDRSGTTMLRLILDRGDEAAIPTESMFLGDFAPVRRGRLDLSDHATAVAFAETVWAHPKVRLWALDGPAPVPPAGLDHEAAYRWCVEAPYRAYAERDGKQRWGDKTPAYLHHIDELVQVWPGVRLLVLVRDGRDVALSIRSLPFGANNAWAAAGDWAEGIRLGMRAAERYPANVLTVRYEDLVANPGDEVRRICDFLGLMFGEQMLEIERSSGAKVVADQAEWFTNLWAGINQKSVGKWRTHMSAREQALFAGIAGAELAANGYDLGEHAHVPVALGSRAVLYRLHDSGARARNFVRLRLVQERGRELRYVMRRKLRM